MAAGDDDPSRTNTYELNLSDDEILEIEYVERDDWHGMSDPCPECNGTEFDHVQYEGGHYGQYQGTVLQRADYWDQHGGLYTACNDCDAILYKHPAYDVLEAFEQGDLE